MFQKKKKNVSQTSYVITQVRQKNEASNECLSTLQICRILTKQPETALQRLVSAICLRHHAEKSSDLRFVGAAGSRNSSSMSFFTSIKANFLLPDEELNKVRKLATWCWLLFCSTKQILLGSQNPDQNFCEPAILSLAT